MDRYEKENAINKVDGYYVRSIPPKSEEHDFVRARKQCVEHLERQLANIKALSFADFMEWKRHGKIDQGVTQ